MSYFSRVASLGLFLAQQASAQVLPLELQANASSNILEPVEDFPQGRNGSGQVHRFAGQVTGIPAEGSTVDNIQINARQFRAVCEIDSDCVTNNCEVQPEPGVNAANRQDVLAQGISGQFFCGNPDGSDPDDPLQEPCQSAADRDANNPDSLDPLDFEFARVDGYCNNLNESQQHWGSRNVLQRRVMNGVFLDIEEERSGAPESISPRRISDEVNNEPGDIPNQYGTSTLLAYCGQFIDHDITLIEFQPPETRIDIEGSPPTDARIVFELSVSVPGSFPVLNPNSNTAIVDLSMTYGSTAAIAFSLRKPGYLAVLDFSVFNISGNPEMFMPLAVSINGDLTMPPTLPNDEGIRFAPTAMSPAVPNLFASGDIRVNEQVMLISWHTLFLREHNRLVNDVVLPVLQQQDAAFNCPQETPQETASMSAPANCELMYQLARRVNIAQWQNIVFDEYFSTWHEFPITTNGPNSLITKYQDLGGYKENVNAHLDIFFSTASYRFGHTIVRTYVVERGSEPGAQADSVFLGNAFFNTEAILSSPNGVAGFLYGASTQCGASRDQFVSTGIRNFLFGSIPQSEFTNSDLIAFNIERGRDHNIALYNDAVAFYGLEPATSFEDIVTRNAPADFVTPQCYIDTLTRVFGQNEDGSDAVDNIDPFVAMLLEPASRGQIGETMFQANDDQFLRFMQGDRFLFLNTEGPTPNQLAAVGLSVTDIREITTATIMNRNLFEGRGVVIDSLTGATQNTAGANNVFSQTAFQSVSGQEGECCVSQSDSVLTPMCFRNQTNPYDFFVQDLTRCEALAALEAQAASQFSSPQGAFAAGTMLPITFTSYDCQCNKYYDEVTTISGTLAVQGLSDTAVAIQLALDMANMLPNEDPASVQQRIPASAITVRSNGGAVNFAVDIQASSNTGEFSAGDVMWGEMEYNLASNMALAADPNAVLTMENVVEFQCDNCPPLPSDFIVGENSQAASAEPTLLGFSTVIGGVIIGVIALVVVVILGCGARFYMNKRSQQQMFTSGQESV